MPERFVLQDADRPVGLASAVRDAPELVVQGGLERPAVMEISIVELRALHWLWAARAREDSHARRAAMDSNLVWGQTSLEKWDALSRRVVPKPLGKLPAAQMQEAASQQASPPREPAEQ
jgi:hypothetical protein